MQKIATKNYMFRHHLETGIEELFETKDSLYKSIRSLSPLNGTLKVRINHIGHIVLVGEY